MGTVFSQELDTMYYEDGSIKAFGRLDEEGKTVKEWSFFYPSGVLSAMLVYNNKGELDGNQLLYDEIGNLIAAEHWVDDLLQDSAKYFYPNGETEKEGVFKEGLYEGRWLFYYSNGNIKREGNYILGSPNGQWTFYFENGNINQQGELIGGKETGFWKYFDEDGNATYEGNWEEGEKVGQWYLFKRGVKKKWKKFN